jgi:ribosomal protein L40E
MGPHLDPKMSPNLFIAIWVGLLVASVIFFNLASPQLKRAVFPYGAVLGGLLMLLFVYLMGGKSQFYFALVPVAVIMFLNIQTVRICPQCGATNNPTGFFSVARYCRRCGTALER